MSSGVTRARGTKQSNQIRRLCYEFGYIIAPYVRKIRDLDLTQIPSVIYETVCELYDEFKSIDTIILHKEKEISQRVTHHSVGKICSLFLALVLSMHWLVNTRLFGSILQTIEMVGIYRRILDWYLK